MNSNEINQVMNSCMESFLVEAPRNKVTCNRSQTRTKTWGWSLKTVPGPMVEGASVEGPGEAGQDH